MFHGSAGSQTASSPLVPRKRLLREAKTFKFWTAAGDVAVRLKRASGERARFCSVGRAEAVRAAAERRSEVKSMLSIYE